jgi:hypothetical protein
MKQLYVVYECDNHRNYSTYVIKLITANKSVAIQLFNSAKHCYEDQDYFLNACEYSPVMNPACDNNVFDEFEIPFLTTEE